MKRGALMAYPWSTPELFGMGLPYFPWYFAHKVVCWRPRLIWMIFATGLPFLYNAVRICVLVIAPKALGSLISKIPDPFFPFLDILIYFLYRI